MSILALTPFKHGKEDGTVVEINVGDDLSSHLDDAQLQQAVEAGAALETGSTRKYNSPLYDEASVTAASEDKDTAKRDQLVAQAMSGLLDADPDDIHVGTTTGGGATAVVAGKDAPGNPPAGSVGVTQVTDKGASK